MFAVYVILSALGAIVIKYLRDYLNFRKYYSDLPGSKDLHPLLGNLHLIPGFGEDGLVVDHETSRLYKYFNRVWAGPFDAYVLVYHPDSVKEIIKSNAIKPRNSGGFISTSYDMGVQWIGEGLILTNGPKWYHNRRLITPSFHFDILKKYIQIYNDCARVLLSKMDESSTSNTSIDIQSVISRYTLDVILRCAFSSETDCQTKTESNEYAEAIHTLQDGWMKRLLKPGQYNEFIYKFTADGKRFYDACDVTHRHCERIIKARQAELQLSANKTTNLTPDDKVRDFLDTLLMARDDEGKGMSLDDMRSEVDTFLFAGHDTTASGITWTLMCLAQNPRHQELVYQEVKAVLGGKGHVSYENLGQLSYTTQCIKEALRMHAAVPGVDRVTTQDVELNGYKIKAGTHIFMHIWALHNNPHVWDDPFEYRPERFAPDKVAAMDPYQFIPFSAGARNCIGQNFAMNEMKTTIAKIIQNFQLSDDKDKPVKRLKRFTMKAEAGAFVFVTPRDN